MAESVKHWMFEYLLNPDGGFLRVLLPMNGAAIVAVIGLAGGLRESAHGSGIVGPLIVFAAGAIFSAIGFIILGIHRHARGAAHNASTKAKNTSGHSIESIQAMQSRASRLTRTRDRLRAAVLTLHGIGFGAFVAGVVWVIAWVW